MYFHGRGNVEGVMRESRMGHEGGRMSCGICDEVDRNRVLHG